ncbi:hypothetical protein [Janibacter melonis]|uniref:hypothetical protein n=1 Tax=Janibacter melonis TaxID=262209 RepID=UPI00177E7B8D|nr:hypothetical protein [Janibacter melonis]
MGPLSSTAHPGLTRTRQRCSRGAPAPLPLTEETSRSTTRIISTLATAALATTGLVAVAAPAQADRTCSGTITGRTIDDDVVVPAGATCKLTTSVVKADVVVRRGATLQGWQNSVDGNIQSEGNRSTQNVIRNRVKGDIQPFSNPSGTKYVYDTSVDGNLQCKSNTSAPKGWNTPCAAPRRTSAAGSDRRHWSPLTP